MDNKRGRMGPGIGIYFVLSELASTEDERIGSNAVIRGATVWRHLPAAKPVTPLSCENAAVWSLSHRGKTFIPLSTCF
jgi:hypothetical protein